MDGYDVLIWSRGRIGKGGDGEVGGALDMGLEGKSGYERVRDGRICRICRRWEDM